MKAAEVKKLAENFGNRAQEAAEECNRLVEIIDSLDGYEGHVEAWQEDVSGQGEEVVATLDLLVNAAAQARDSIAAALAEKAVA